MPALCPSESGVEGEYARSRGSDVDKEPLASSGAIELDWEKASQYMYVIWVLVTFTSRERSMRDAEKESQLRDVRY
eukprot:2966394-Rhodomonas_salina.2